MQKSSNIFFAGLIAFVQFVTTNNSIAQQRYCGELGFGAKGIGPNDMVYVTITADANLTNPGISTLKIWGKVLRMCSTQISL